MGKARGPHKQARLTALRVRNEKRPGLHADGGALYLRVLPSGSKQWMMRIMVRGKRRDIGLGGIHTVPLADARSEARRLRQLVRQGVDVLAERRKARQGVPIFKECAQACIASMEKGWKNEKHRRQWSATLERYVYPIMGGEAVDDIGIEDVLAVLEKVWLVRPETASRLRGRIEKVIDFATAHGYRTGENPARWKGRLDALLPARNKVAKPKHHPAMPYEDVGAFMVRLAEKNSASSLALRFLIYTAARSGEVLGAKWSEVNEDKAVWIVPAVRTKTGREHVIPLSDAALEVLRAAKEISQGGFIFPGARAGRPLSDMSLLMQLRRMGMGQFTAHGFRSSFRTWAAEATNFANHVCEQALGHVIASAVEAAYQRGSLLKKRRELMDAWATYCTSSAGGTVVQLHGKA